MPEQTDTRPDGSAFWRQWARRLVLGSLVVLLGLLAFAGSLVWYMPVRFVAHQAGWLDTGPVAVNRLSGTVWQGQMQIDGGHSATWTMRPGASLLAFGLVADWRVAGPGTDLMGGVVLRSGGVELGPVSGMASWPLVMAFMPGVPITCSGQARFAAVEIRAGRSVREGSGTVTTSAADCARVGSATPVPTPALHAQISTQPDAVQMLVTPQDGARVALLTARLTAADRVIVTIHRAGAALVPGMPATTDSELDLPLAALFGI